MDWTSFLPCTFHAAVRRSMPLDHSCVHTYTQWLREISFSWTQGVRVSANSLQGSDPQKRTPYRIGNAECVLFDNKCVHRGWSPKISDQVIRGHHLSDRSRRWPPLDDLNGFNLQGLTHKNNYINRSASVLLEIWILEFAIFAKHDMGLYYSTWTRRLQRLQLDPSRMQNM